eukprot:bmy_06616T0
MLLTTAFSPGCMQQSVVTFFFTDSIMELCFIPSRCGKMSVTISGGALSLELSSIVGILKLDGTDVFAICVGSSCVSEYLTMKLEVWQEEELRKSGEAKYAHLSDELHVLIEVFAPPGEAYSRMSHALEEIKKFLVPDYAFTFFDPNDPAFQEILFDPQTTIAELFAIVHQRVPQVQYKIDVIGNEILRRG